jgi:uncharacterized protein YfcZ (UPF0381/DUF406 family)
VHPERDEKYRRFYDQIAELELRLQRMEQRARNAEDQLESIFKRVREQVTVWLDYPDDKRIYLVGVLKEPDQKKTPLI